VNSTIFKICSKCKKNKSIKEYHFRKDSKKYRNICKQCWSIKKAANRLGITCEQVINFRKESLCMCCGEDLTNLKKNLHHVEHKVKGILCHYCNITLGQETKEDLHRIKSCLEFIQKDRKNLFNRVNQQGSQQKEPDPSTTTRATQRLCKCCKQYKPKKNFYKQKYQSGKYGLYATCKDCYKILVKTYVYNLTFEQVSILRNSKNCDCCNNILTLPYIHHVDNKVLGVVCRKCNTILEQENEITKHKLQSCYNWLMKI